MLFGDSLPLEVCQDGHALSCMTQYIDVHGLEIVGDHVNNDEVGIFEEDE